MNSNKAEKLQTTWGKLSEGSTILRLKEVVKRTGLSRSTIYAKLKQDSRHFDEGFPRSFAIGARSRGWLASEVDLWIASKAQIRN